MFSAGTKSCPSSRIGSISCHNPEHRQLAFDAFKRIHDSLQNSAIKAWYDFQDEARRPQEDAHELSDFQVATTTVYREAVDLVT